MHRRRPIRVMTSQELAKALGLSPAEGAELEVRAELNQKIIEVVKRRKITHAQLAHLAGSSRSRMTALLNRRTEQISTDLMLRVLAVLGYKAKLTVSHVA